MKTPVIIDISILSYLTLERLVDDTTRAMSKLPVGSADYAILSELLTIIRAEISSRSSLA